MLQFGFILLFITLTHNSWSNKEAYEIVFGMNFKKCEEKLFYSGLDCPLKQVN